ncbi:magnesium and cobalt transport protein [Salmonella enterica subsp. enterica]|uniref:Magnesium and cobalt transport protein n=1 Tax=Salmonella enterica I TaxID=59201 RepID=A0A3S5DDX6_SALET|nr:magnesium and cobalt transport protein [Salmonella enterica subsp. enterica]
MLSAFQLEKNRLTRLEVEESQSLIDARMGRFGRTGRRRAIARTI